MKFYKVSLDQFSKDYAKVNGLGPIGDWSEEDRKKVIDIWTNIKLPRRSTSGSAGYDFFIPYDESFSPDFPTSVPTGIRFECDEDKFLLCLPRSGAGFKYGAALINTAGVIDCDYFNSSNEGHIMCKITTKVPFTLENGKALMQGIIMPYFKVDDDISEGIRNGGFGSTGM